MAVNPLVAVEMTKLATDTIKALGDYLKTHEVEETERARIRATLSTITEKINADQEVFVHFMNNSFTERERLYKMADKALNKAIEKADTEMMKLALNYTITVYNKNPLDGFEQKSQDFLTSGIKDFL